MAKSHNFLLGNGDSLTEEVPWPGRDMGKKSHPYSVDQARKRLLPRAEEMLEQVMHLPSLACPGDETVVIFTLHPAYIAKSYFPNKLLALSGLRAVGSRSVQVKPEQSMPLLLFPPNTYGVEIKSEAIFTTVFFSKSERIGNV